MPAPHPPGFFDIETRTAKLTAMGDPLVKLNAQINWEAFRPDLARVHERERKSNAGAKPIDVVLMFKMLVLQHLYNSTGIFCSIFRQTPVRQKKINR